VSLTLTLDKSILQQLAFREIDVLHDVYRLNIVPVLMIEILGDLDKRKEGASPQEAVSRLAAKIARFSSVVNVHFRDLVRCSLLYDPFSKDRVPVLSKGRQVVTPEGEKGVIFDVAPEDSALQRWRDKEFESSEQILAERWRQSTRGFDICSLRDTLKSLIPKQENIKDLSSLNSFVDMTLSDLKHQRDLLSMAVCEYIPFEEAQSVFLRWEMAGCPHLSSYAPYVFYCLRVNLFFSLGLIQDLIGPRSTNRVDMEYLYYLPFCKVFCSSDKFHKNVAPFFLDKDQQFIIGSDMENDLKELAQQRNEEGKYPFWRESLAGRLSAQFNEQSCDELNLASNMSPEQKKLLAQFFEKKMQSSTPLEKRGFFGDDTTKFVLRKFEMRRSDPCPCGRGKSFAECCGSKDMGLI